MWLRWGWHGVEGPTAIFQMFVCCMLTECLLCSCCVLAACLLHACFVLAAYLLHACCVLAARLLRACCVLACCVLAACLLHAWCVLVCASCLLYVCLINYLNFTPKLGSTRGSPLYAYGSSPSSCLLPNMVEPSCCLSSATTNQLDG